MPRRAPSARCSRSRSWPIPFTVRHCAVNARKEIQALLQGFRNYWIAARLGRRLHRVDRCGQQAVLFFRRSARPSGNLFLATFLVGAVFVLRDTRSARSATTFFSQRLPPGSSPGSWSIRRSRSRASPRSSFPRPPMGGLFLHPPAAAGAHPLSSLFSVRSTPWPFSISLASSPPSRSRTSAEQGPRRAHSLVPPAPAHRQFAGRRALIDHRRSSGRYSKRMVSKWYQRPPQMKP